MKFLIVDSYYSIFLDEFYRQHPNLLDECYDHQHCALMDQCFGSADFYSLNLQKLGFEAKDIAMNCKPMQLQWAKENGVKTSWNFERRKIGPFPIPWLRREWLYPILLEQVKSYRLDVIHFQNPELIRPVFLMDIRPFVRLITAQIASPYANIADFSNYDLMLSSFPHYVQRFKDAGLRSAYFRLGFEPKVLQRLRRVERYGAVFVGGMSRAHQERIRFFESLAQKVRFDWWGYGADELSPDSPLKKIHRGQAWALDMYEILADAKIVINHHIDSAENYANNMRLYEATGVGAMLLTDWKENIADHFEPGKEVVVYRDVNECAEKIEYYMKREEERKEIAAAGQARTLREHTYYQRMEEYVRLVKQYV
ncbi:MAG: glycosyltransferase [Candidatus Omnitrophota bacterium]